MQKPAVSSCTRASPAVSGCTRASPPNWKMCQNTYKTHENQQKSKKIDKIKQNLFDALVESNSFQIPKVMIEAELESLKQNTAKRLGIDLKDFEDGNFPVDSLEEEAEKRVRIGVILNQLIEDKSLKPDPDKVKELIEQRASMYKEPQQVVNWFYSNQEQLQNIEAISLEEQVVDIMLEESSPMEEQMTYEECITGN